MQKYELSKYDFEALSKAMRNAIGDGSKIALNSHDVAVLRVLQERFEAAHTAWLEVEGE